MPFKSDKQRRWMHSNKPKLADKWENKYQQGGYLGGASHEEGGIPIEAEGGEFIIKKDSVNRSTLDMLEYINDYGDLPMSNAKKRRK